MDLMGMTFWTGLYTFSFEKDDKLPQPVGVCAYGGEPLHPLIVEALLREKIPVRPSYSIMEYLCSFIAYTEQFGNRKVYVAPMSHNILQSMTEYLYDIVLEPSMYSRVFHKIPAREKYKLVYSIRNIQNVIKGSSQTYAEKHKVCPTKTEGGFIFDYTDWGVIVEHYRPEKFPNLLGR